MNAYETLLAFYVHAAGIDAATEQFAALATGEDYQPGLPAAARAARVRELEQQRRALLREEELEALTLEATHLDSIVVRRPAAKLDLPLILDVWNKTL